MFSTVSAVAARPASPPLMWRSAGWSSSPRPQATAAAEKFGADYGLSVTGFAGPGGGTEADPVGTVYLGYASPSGVWSRRLSIPGDRLQVKARAVNTALDWMRRKLNRYRVEDILHGG